MNGISLGFAELLSGVTIKDPGGEALEPDTYTLTISVNGETVEISFEIE